MKDNVVQLHKAKVGEQSFFLCACNPNDPHPFVPIVIVQMPPIVVGLLCPNCERHLHIVNGVIQPEK